MAYRYDPLSWMDEPFRYYKHYPMNIDVSKIPQMTPEEQSAWFKRMIGAEESGTEATGNKPSGDGEQRSSSNSVVGRT